MSVLEIFLLTLGFTLILFYRLWVYAIKINNFSIVDVAWSAGFAIQAVLFCFLSSGTTSRKLLLLAIVALWSIRLSYFLGKRIAGHHPKEDTRYAKLREDYGANYKKRFLKFFMLQALSISFLTLPAIFVFNNINQNLGLLEYAGLISFLISLTGEALADNQMKNFKNVPANKGKVCNVGLWKYSRHPNYFFESCIWFNFYIFWLGTSGLW